MAEADKTVPARLTHIEGEKLEKFSITTEADAKKITDKIDAQRFTVISVERKAGKPQSLRHPSPPPPCNRKLPAN